MKQIFCFLILTLLTQQIIGQITIDDILSLPEEKEKTYEPKIKSGNQLFLKMAYGSSYISNQHEIKKLDGAMIASIDIVYSDHPEGDRFTNLTRKRLESLNVLKPSLFSNPAIEWRFVRQTNYNDKESAKKLFHGAVITYRPAQTEEEIKKEIEYLQDMFSEKAPTSSETEIKPSKKGTKRDVYGCLFALSIPPAQNYDLLWEDKGNSVDISYILKKTFKPSAELIDYLTENPEFYLAYKFDLDTVSKKLVNVTPHPKNPTDVFSKEIINAISSLPTLNFIPRTNSGIAFSKDQYELHIYLAEELRQKEVPDKMATSSIARFPVNPDPTVKEVLNRMNWTNLLIVADLTGSMSPYTAQLVLWFKLNTVDNKVKQFVFFNDGDSTPDRKKVIGETGGIYDTRSSVFEDVKELAYKTMKSGNGGDSPENDIEALIKAIELCPNCNDIVLIADNWSPIKDIRLLSNIQKPIRIILCGSDYRINTEYLDLARTTGGSVHTMEDDLMELMKINEGETITINGQIFEIENGKFVRISKI